MMQSSSEQLWRKLNEMESHCEIRKFSIKKNIFNL